MSDFFYQSGAMGYDGNGWFWHNFLKYKFPKYPFVTKTITLNPKRGISFAVIPLGKSVWNKIMLRNPGIVYWIDNYYPKVENTKDMIVSIHGTDEEIQEMCNLIDGFDIKGIELNFSCPNVKNPRNKIIPKTKHYLYLKLSYNQNPNIYDMNRIKEIHLNSVNMFGGGVSGKLAQRYNWEFIKKHNEFNVSGSSWVELDDIKRLEDIGCKNIGIGSVILTNPKLLTLI